MGTDIHPFIEYVKGDCSKSIYDSDNVSLFNKGEFLVTQDYKLFDRLAGARARACERPAECLVPPRGLPKNVSYWTLRRYCVAVDPSYNASCLSIPLVVVPEQNREKTIAAGPALSRQPFWRGRGEEFEELYANSNWHSTSWLTLSEIESVLYAHSAHKPEFEFRLIMTIMKQLEQELGPEKCRLVFWFDN